MYDGLFPAVVNAIAKVLNLTVDYVPFDLYLPWGFRFENGTWIGAIADVANGKYATSAGGFSATYDRIEIGKMSTFPALD